jgi:hypothetical protein
MRKDSGAGSEGAGTAPEGTAAGPTVTGGAPGETGIGPLPRRIRQASLAPQLKQPPARHTDQPSAQAADRDADEVRSRMASLQRGWRRGR